MPPEIAFLFWLCMVAAALIAATPEPCYDAACRMAHHQHVQRQRRAEVTRGHALHTEKRADCDRCRDG